jgi:HEAT repeat protein
VTIAEALLKKQPSNHAALLLDIEALSVTAPGTRALDAYERATQTRGEDMGLLAPVARGLLREIAAQPGAPERLAALSVLAEDGDETAMTALKQTDRSDAAVLLDLAEAGDSRAAAAMVDAFDQAPAPMKGRLLDELSRRHIAVPPASIAPLLNDESPETRAAAARAAAGTTATALVPTLEGLLKDPDPQVRNNAALALKRLGSTAGSEIADALINSELAAVRLEALSVLRDDPSVPVAALAAAALQDPDPLVRLSAAELVAASQPGVAAAMVAEIGSSENPAVAGAAARVMGSTGLTLPTGSLVGLLRSTSPMIRVQAGRTVLGRARGGEIAPTPMR